MSDSQRIPKKVRAGRCRWCSGAVECGGACGTGKRSRSEQRRYVQYGAIRRLMRLPCLFTEYGVLCSGVFERAPRRSREATFIIAACRRRLQPRPARDTCHGITRMFSVATPTGLRHFALGLSRLYAVPLRLFGSILCLHMSRDSC